MKTLFFFFLLLLTLTGCGTEQLQSAKVESNLQEALRQSQNGNVREARLWADRAIAADPNEVHVYASESEEDPADDTPQLTIADVFGAAGDDATTVDYLQQAQRKFPKSAAPLAPLEAAQGRLGDVAGQQATARALATMLEARIDMPRTIPGAALLNRLAQAYFDAGDPVKGAEIYHRVITTFPFDPQADDARNGLAYAYAVRNDTAHLPEAETLATLALTHARNLVQQGKASDESVGAIQDTLGWVQYRLGKPEALSNLQQAMNADPREAEIRYHLAMAYKSRGNLEAARAELERAVLLKPGYAAPTKELAALPHPAA